MSWSTKKKPIILQFIDKIVVDPNSSCWLWKGATNKNKKTPQFAGYGVFGRPLRYAHRFSFEFFNGPIGAGLVVDHKCKITLCVNPRHLDAVTNRENLARGISPNWVTHETRICKRGHKIMGRNAYKRKDGRIRCKKCLWGRRKREASR